MTSTILITGTSSGLGRATAQLFQARGWNVIATMRNPAQETELNGLDRTLVTRLDVQDIASIQSAVAAGIARFGGIDVLVNNAGYGAYGPLEATSLDKIRRQFDVNVIGLLATTQALLPHFRANRKGTVVNIPRSVARSPFRWARFTTAPSSPLRGSRSPSITNWRRSALPSCSSSRVASPPISRGGPSTSAMIRRSPIISRLSKH